METQIVPSEYIARILRQYSPNDFVISYRSYNPTQQLPMNGVNINSSPTNVEISLTGSTNEFALMDQTYLSCNLSGNIPVTLTDNSVFSDIKASPLNRGTAASAPCFKYGTRFLDSTVESYNANALRLYQNQNNPEIINTLRALFARSNASIENDSQFNITDDFFWNNLKINRLEASGYGGTSSRSRGVGLSNAETITNVASTISIPVGGALQDRTITVFNNTTNLCKAIDTKTFKLPIQTFSVLGSTTLALPLGLMSNLNVTGALFSFRFAGDSLQVPNISPSVGSGLYKINNTGLAIDPSNAVCMLNSVSMVVPIITCFNNDLMQQLLSTYRGEQALMIDGMMVPTSLRFNTINYDNYDYEIRPDQSYQRFSLPSSRKSVRAVSWLVYNPNDKNNILLTGSTSTSTVTSDRSVTNYPLLSDKLECTGIRLTFGRNQFLPVVENNSISDDNVNQFIYDQIKKCAWVFSSAGPYWNEADNRNCGPEDVIFPAMKRASESVANAINIPNTGGAVYDARSYRNINYGCISLMNSEIRGSGDALVASGLSLNSVGRMDFEMRFQNRENDTTRNSPSRFISVGSNYRIRFLVAYDEVVSATSSLGMQIITDSVLP